MVPVSVAHDVHVTLGTFFGIRPYTSRSKSSTNSARRRVQSAALVTLCPSFSVRTIRKVGEGIGLGLVVVRVIRVLLVAARTGSQCFDPELFHHLLMVLGRCPSF